MIFDTNCPSTSSLEQLPNEILDSIFSNLDIQSLCVVRSLNRRLKNVVTHSNKISRIFPKYDWDRFCVRFDEDLKCYEIYMIRYSPRKEQSLYITDEDIGKKRSLRFLFRNMSIRRIHLRRFPDGTLSDKFVNFLVSEFRQCCSFGPIGLTISECDMSGLSSEAMSILIKSCGKSLSHLTISKVYNARNDTFSDIHVNILDLKNINGLYIVDISMANGHQYLSITDYLFTRLIEEDVFPALQLQLCLVSTLGLAAYLKKWIEYHEFSGFSNISCTFKDCPDISQKGFIFACRNSPVEFSQFSDDFVSVFHESQGFHTFTVNFGKETYPDQEPAHGFSIQAKPFPKK